MVDLTESERKSKYLAEIDIYRDLLQDEIDLINEHAPMKTYRRGEMLYTPDAPVERLFMLKTGQVRVFRVSEDGRSLTTAMIGAGTVFGEMVLLGQRMHGQYAEAVEDTMLCLMSREDVQKFLMGNVKVAARIAELLGERFFEMEQRRSDTVFKPGPQRVAGTLHTLAGRSLRGGPVDLLILTFAYLLTGKRSHGTFASLPSNPSRSRTSAALHSSANGDRSGRPSLGALHPCGAAAAFL